MPNPQPSPAQCPSCKNDASNPRPLVAAADQPHTMIPCRDRWHLRNPSPSPAQGEGRWTIKDSGRGLADPEGVLVDVIQALRGNAPRPSDATLANALVAAKQGIKNRASDLQATEQEAHDYVDEIGKLRNWICCYPTPSGKHQKDCPHIKALNDLEATEEQLARVDDAAEQLLSALHDQEFPTVPVSDCMGQLRDALDSALTNSEPTGE